MKKRLLGMVVQLQGSPDLLLALGIGAIVGALVIPLPAWALDVGLAVNLAMSAALLIGALYARNPLSVTSFPTLLLINTLFRLSLNVSSTRLALSEGHAGEIIQAFGEFVVRGDYWVGAASFLILAVVQFLVVAKGAERVAEVSARFTLDAMPGKQMSVDADLRAGIIDSAQAQARRQVLERESQMFGAMDGAMKFVKGDVIAGLLIVLVNLGAGTALGMVSHGMSFHEAAATYALIAIGDGLVSQLPSLCIALAAGLLVTRVGGEGRSSIGADIAHQFLADPRVLGVVAGLCAALALVPGTPHLTFAGLTLAIGALAFIRLRTRINPVLTSGGPEALKNRVSKTVGVAPLVVALADDLSAAAEANQQSWVKRELETVRESVYLDLGIRPPGIVVRARHPGLAPGHFLFLLDEVPVCRGSIQWDCFYVDAPVEALVHLGVNARSEKDWGRGQPISVIDATDHPKLVATSVSAHSPLEWIALQVGWLLRRHASLLLGLQETRALVDELEPQAPALVQETLQKVPLPLLTDVLRQLLAEQVSIRNLRCIFESLAAPSTEGDAAALVERCRQGLRRYLSFKYAPRGPLYAYLADPGLEEALRGEGGPTHSLDPSKVERILQSLKQIADRGRAVVLTAHDTRRTLYKLCEGNAPGLAVLTYRELDPELQIRPVGRLSA